MYVNEKTAEVLNDLILPDYIADIEERVYHRRVRFSGRKFIVPDVRIIRGSHHGFAAMPRFLARRAVARGFVQRGG